MNQRRNIILLVLVASLGYFVDIYDLLIFSIVRVKSLQDIGIAPIDMRQTGEYILNMQMAGLLIGGILWGVLGDRMGRLKVLFGSILLYSVSNVINSFVHDENSYALIRFFAGLGLAGELGAGITLISETMPKEKRGYGTMLVAVIGLFGAVAAKEVAQHFDWRKAYLVGGILGFVLLLLRIGVAESGLYKNLTNTAVRKGNLAMLFNNKERFGRFIKCILIGLPFWFVVGILLTQAPEFGKALEAPKILDAGAAIMFAYIGISVGDLIAGLLAQIFRSRKKVLYIFNILSLIVCSIYLCYKGITQSEMNWLSFLIGIGSGYWANFVTIASEQFGTNMRATVTTSVPNFVRGALIPITWIFDLLLKKFNLINSAFAMLFILYAIAIYALSRLKESFGNDLNFVEE
ncbi:MAG: MFS transporter [Arachidicoccus sp.]|nr:MFS transporter [Arachidicoccus sp.]